MGTRHRHHVGHLHPKEVRTHDVQIRQVKTVQVLGQKRGPGQRVAVFHVVVAVERRQAQTHTLAANGGANGGQHLKQKAAALLHAAAIRIAALVGTVAQKLVDQITVGAVHLNPVKTRSDRVLGGLGKGLHDGRDFGLGQGVWHGVGQFAFGRLGFARQADGAGRNDGRAAVHGGVRGAASVPNLHEDLAAFGVHRLGGGLPGFDLSGVVNARLVHKRRGVFRNHRALGDDQAGAGALAVVLGHERVGHVPRIGPRTGQGGHEHAVVQGESASAKGFKQHGVRSDQKKNKTDKRSCPCVRQYGTDRLAAVFLWACWVLCSGWGLLHGA